MSEDPQSPRSEPHDWLTGLREVIPPLALAGALWAMLFVSIPQVNHDPVLSIISGFLGFMVGRATKSAQP